MDTTVAGRRLHAGPLTVTLEGAELRWLRLGDEELIRGIYVAVRDETWGTVAGRLEDVQVDDAGDGFDVGFTSVHRDSGVAFRWRGRIHGGRDGSITFAMDGMAESTFLRNRIGFCLLHPLTVAGRPVTVDTPDGAIVGEFPDRISPHQPFREIEAIRWPTAVGPDAQVRFEGDLFEMEDQRNWTDASFKTYCTPLRIPYPVRIEQGTTIHQAIELRLGANTQTIAKAAPRDRAHGDGVQPASAAEPAQVQLGEPVGRLPLLGVALAPGRERLGPADAARIRDRHLGLLFVTVDLGRPDWPAVVEAAAESARGTATPLRVEVIADDAGDGLPALLDALAASNAAIDSIIAFPTAGFATTRPVAERLRREAGRRGITATLIGGSRAHFTELNRAENLPLDALDAIAYPLSPQVHAFDDASIIETIAAQGLTVRDALRIGEGRPVHVGPINLRPRFNAYGDRRRNWDLEHEALRIDPRQRTWFAAPWMLASIGALGSAGANSVVCFEAAGPASIIDDHDGDDRGRLAPAEQVLAALDGLAGGVIARTEAPADVAALAVQTPDGWSVLVAHHRSTPRAIAIRHDLAPSRVTASILGAVAQSMPLATDPSGATMDVPPATLVRVDFGGTGGQ